MCFTKFRKLKSSLIFQLHIKEYDKEICIYKCKRNENRNLQEIIKKEKLDMIRVFSTQSVM